MSRLGWTLSCVCLAGALAGCQGQSDFSRMGELVYHKLIDIAGSGDISRAQVLAVPYATLGLRLGSSDQAMLVLGSSAGDTQQWVGGTQYAVATRNGRIIRTAGLASNLSGVEEGPTSSDLEPRDYRYDLADLNAYGIAVRCTPHVAGPERIVIVGNAHDTVHVIEECSAPELDWTFRNEFWRDPGGNIVWQSVQYVHPNLDPITTQTLRPVG